MTARITKYYIEVLGARGDPLEPQLSASLSLSGVVSYELVATRSVSSSLSMAQTKTAPKEMTESVSGSLEFTATGEYIIGLANNLEITQSVEVHGILRKNVSNSINFTDTFSGVRDIDVYPISGGAEYDSDTGIVTPKTFVFSEVATYVATFTRSLSNSVSFTDIVDDSIGPEESNSFSFGHSVDVEQVKTMSNSLLFQQTVVVRRSSTNPSSEDTIRFDHTVTYSVERVNLDCTYSPFAGGTSDPSTSDLFPSEPETITRNYVELKYPPASPTTILTLKGPELSDRHRLNFQRVNRETRGGSLIIFADSIWPKIQTLSLQFVGLSETEGQEVLDFIDLTLGKQIDIVDWKSRVWRGFITTPQEPLVRNHNCNLAVNFDFEGDQLINTVEETSLIIFSQHVYIGLFTRPEESELIFTQEVVYAGMFIRPEEGELEFTQVVDRNITAYRSEPGSLEFTQVSDWILHRYMSNSILFVGVLTYNAEYSRSESNPLILTQVINETHIEAKDTPWIGYEADKLYLTSGQFSSTIKTSQAIGSIDNAPLSISWDGNNTPWSATESNKLYLTSGQFSSTLKTSQTLIYDNPQGISWDGTDTPWSCSAPNKLYLTSGQFTSTIKTSQNVGSIDGTVTGISFDGTNTPWSGATDDKLYLQSGQFSSTIKTSQAVGTIDTAVRDISWDGTNTPWTGNIDIKLYLTSGQFSSTLKTSRYIGDIDLNPQGIETNRLNHRLSKRYSESGSLVFTQEVDVHGSLGQDTFANLILTQVINEIHIEAKDTPWIGSAVDKLYLTSGQFSSTIKTSQDVGTIDVSPGGVSWDGNNTPWVGTAANKLYLASGQFSSTLKTSQYIGDIDNNSRGISWDGTDTPWIGQEAEKLYLQSGQFTSTLKTSEDVSGIDTYTTGISFNGTDTPWCAAVDKKLYLTSGQFSSTLKTSQYIGDIDTIIEDISWDGTDTPWAGSIDHKLYLTSGQFSSTLKTSQYIGGVNSWVNGICTNNLVGRLDL